MKKKFLTLVMSMALVFSMLTGCGSSKDDYLNASKPYFSSFFSVNVI